MSSELEILQEKIRAGRLYKIPENIEFDNVDSNSWFNIRTYSYNNFAHKPNIEFDDYDDIDGYYTKQYKLYPSKQQGKIIDKWIDAYTLMYNEAVHYLNINGFCQIGTLKKKLKKEKGIVQKKSAMIVNKKNKYINSHTLDYAMNDAVSRMKSCMANLKQGNIKHFRMRKIKLTKKDRIMKLEKSAFTNNSFCTTVLGDILECHIDDFNYIENIHTVATIKKRVNEYFLLLKYSTKISHNTTNKSIGIDQGYRTFATCYGNKEVLEIGNNAMQKIMPKINKIKRLQQNIKIKENATDSNTSGKTRVQKQRIINKHSKKIKDIVTDLHWKSIKYITDHYDNIIIGNLSTKSINENVGTAKIMKIVGSLLGAFTFRQRLKYKCYTKGKKYKVISEKHTTQCCGNCGNQKKNLGSNKVYNCTVCGKVMDRDINSARLILIKSEK